LQKLADMGYFGIVIPEQYGGWAWASSSTA